MCFVLYSCIKRALQVLCSESCLRMPLQRTIVIALLQPDPLTYDLFDDILVLSEGAHHLSRPARGRHDLLQQRRV